MKILRSPNFLCGALLIYATGMFIYFFPRNHVSSLTEKCVIVGVSYAVIVILWFILRRRNKMRDKDDAGKYGEYPHSTGTDKDKS